VKDEQIKKLKQKIGDLVLDNDILREALNAWLQEWAVTVADQRVHGTTHERPIDRFARETLTPLGQRPPYRYERVRLRPVPADALVAIAAARYSVPVEYVGTTVHVQETSHHYEIFHGGTCIARHARTARHAVVVDRAHYRGLLRAGNPAAMPRPSGDAVGDGAVPVPEDAGDVRL
jgi:hypothetical protein